MLTGRSMTAGLQRARRRGRSPLDPMPFQARSRACCGSLLLLNSSSSRESDHWQEEKIKAKTDIGKFRRMCGRRANKDPISPDQELCQIDQWQVHGGSTQDTSPKPSKLPPSKLPPSKLPSSQCECLQRHSPIACRHKHR